ncbi:MAG: ribonuclease P protein component [Chlamydiales bacterium]|nr:ribonuclease P protein component [Chlamydiia bacterium]MCP5508303.1 ribonuclease P protein component [Chlamydiales bacterium]
MKRGVRRFYGKLIIVDTKGNSQGETRMGITCSRRYGKAHQRNRFKRIVREAFRSVCHLLKPGIDILIKPRSAAMHAKTTDIIEELLADDIDITIADRPSESGTETSGKDC